MTCLRRLNGSVVWHTNGKFSKVKISALWYPFFNYMHLLLVLYE
jgi:hypothetical protein